MAKTTRRGTGITKQVIHHHDMRTKEGVDGIRAFFWGLQTNDLDKIEAWARERLQDTGLPITGRDAITAKYGWDTETGYAARAMELVDILRSDVEAGRPLNAALRGYELGRVMEEMLMKFQYEPHVLKRFGSLAGSQRGGSSPKRRMWAVALAEKLVESFPDDELTALWERIPDSIAPIEMETDQADYAIYRDGSYICCADQNVPTENRVVSKLRRSSFEKRYLAPAKKS